MGRCWISSPFILVDPRTEWVIGKVVAKWKRERKWNIICYGRGKETYLLCVEVGEDEFPWLKIFDSIERAAAEKLGASVVIDPPKRRTAPSLPKRGFKLLELEGGLTLWVRRSRKRKAYTLCLCDGYKIIKCLKHLPHRYVEWFSSLVNLGQHGLIRHALEADLKVNVHAIEWELSGRRRREEIVEDEGYGGLHQEKLEDGDWWDMLNDALDDGDTERAKEILVSPEDAEAMGVPEKIIKWVFNGEEEKRIRMGKNSPVGKNWGRSI